MTVLSSLGRLVAAVRIVAATCLALWVPTAAHAQSETIEYYGLDALGSVRVVFDANGNILGRMDYGPFGQELMPSTGKQQGIYAGLFADEEGGLDHADARSYQVRTGRFSTVDPMYGDSSDPQGWNRYTYALNNPIRFTDPDGLLPTDCKTTSSEGKTDSGQTVIRQNTSCSEDGAVGILSIDDVGFVMMGLELALDQLSDSASKLASQLRERRQGKLARMAEECANPTVENGCIKLGMIPITPSQMGAAVGKAGEELMRLAEGLSDKKIAIVINGVKRIPDGFKSTFLYESKNVGYQAFTAQLRAYAEWAADPSRGGKLIIYVRRTTKLSGPLDAAWKAGDLIIQRAFPW
jgi:RHS repeat-associated protein